MKRTRLLLACAFAFMFPLAFCACGEEESKDLNENGNGNEQTEEPTPVVVPTVTNLKAGTTLMANELRVSWTAPGEAVLVEISYWKDGTDESKAQKQTVRNENATLIRVAEYGMYHIAAVAIDNYGHRSEKTEITATPAEKDTPFTWAAMADSCTYVLIEQFMNKQKGTFYSTPHDIDGSSWNIYWQQAHAMDVVVYSYERVKESDPELAATYENYFRLWFANDANNYNNDPSDATGFLNDFTDDMCWICLTLLHQTEATGDNTYAETAKTVYDEYIITRAWTDEKGTGLPWKASDKGRNACTNSPGCLIAAKLYQRYGDEKYLSDAKMLYDFMANGNIAELKDGRVEEPPLTYTQGTFGEACRRLYHITGEIKYMQMAERVINYAATSGRCLTDGILRSEGTSMDQSIFKAVYIPYAVNLVLDEKASYSVRTSLKAFLEKNAETLRTHLNRRAWPEMYCDYYWGTTFSGGTASMGAQTSGASLMEGVARLEAASEEGK